MISAQDERLWIGQKQMNSIEIWLCFSINTTISMIKRKIAMKEAVEANPVYLECIIQML